jgi:hypothetical protein
LSQCTSITRGGERCKGVAIDGSGLCYAHSPNHANARKRAARKGGQRGGRGRPQADLNALKDRLISLGEDVLEGRVDRQDAATAGHLWNVAIGAIRTALKAKEAEELEAKVERLEEAIEEKDVRGRSSSWG